MRQRFFIHNGSCVSLYCEQSSRNGAVLTGWVINGEWEFTLNTDTGVIAYYAPSGYEEMPGCEVLWTDRRFAHYNDAIEWARAYLASPAWARWAIKLRDDAREFSKRFKRACQAFASAWSNRPVQDQPDDDICF